MLTVISKGINQPAINEIQQLIFYYIYFCIRDKKNRRSETFLHAQNSAIVSILLDVLSRSGIMQFDPSYLSLLAIKASSDSVDQRRLLKPPPPYKAFTIKMWFNERSHTVQTYEQLCR